MRFVIGGNELRSVTLEENEGTVVVQLDGVVVAQFNREEGALVIDDSNLTAARVPWRHVPVEG